MRLVAYGTDARMQGAILAARKAGWEALQVRKKADMQKETGPADVVMLPWPHSFKEERLVAEEPDTEICRTDLLAHLPRCRLVLHGSGVNTNEWPQAERFLNPQRDEIFLRRNAQLTAEGAIADAMQRMERALLGRTCLITGFGRIGQELTVRLCAMGAFVVVCARSEEQMRLSHRMGGHPVPLANLPSAVRQAEVVFNTIPARVLGEEALSQMGAQTLFFELASAPFGADPALAQRMGIKWIAAGGLPGKYAPLDAGEALFDAAQRALMAEEKEDAHG